MTSGASPPERQASVLERLSAKRRRLADLHSLRTQVSPQLIVERRPLLTVFASGELEPVDAAAIGSLSDVLGDPRLKGRRSVAELEQDLPVFWSVRSLPAGRIASIVIPRFYSQLFADREDLIRLVDRAVHMAGVVGARCVSLTGLLASATDYGAACRANPGLPIVTTGHATTASAVVLTIANLLQMTRRRLVDEDVAFVGLGSIGSTTLRLLLTLEPHPRSLVLSDVFQKREAMEELMTTLRERHGYRNALTLHQSRGTVPDAVYDGTLIVSATNVANVLDVRRVRPGTLLVDDSEPHSFETTAAFARWNTEHDVLFSDAGLLRSPDEVTRIVYVPADLQDVIPMPAAEDNASSTITGCVLSSLLTAKLGYPETIGPVTLDAALTHFRGVVDAGFGAAWPQCAGRALAPADVASFCERHAGKETT